MLNLVPRVKEKLDLRRPQYSQMKKNFTFSPTLPQTSEALYLINKYASDKKRIALFLELDATTETFILSKKVHVFPTNYPIQEEVCPSAHQRVLNFKHGLREEDIIFVARDTTEFQQEILKKLQDQFKFDVLEMTPGKVYAIELQKK